MKQLKGVYVIDQVSNLGNYAAINANFAKVADFVARGGLATLKSGRNEIDGDKAFVNDVEADLVAPKDRRPEVHHLYFDIQIPLAGPETFGLARFDPAAPGSFDEANDIGFYDQPVEWVTLQPGEFAIFYPNNCVHAPACTLEAPHKNHKLIFKVKA